MLEVKVLSTEQEIAQQIMQQYADFMNQVLLTASVPIRQKIEDEIEKRIWASSEVDAMINGELRQELGLIQPEEIVRDIISVIKENIEFTTDRVTAISGRLVSGGYIIKVLRADFADVLSVQGATYLTDRNVEIPWLNWMLFAGDTPLVYGYRLQLDPNSPANSRTGAIMVRDQSGSWGVPSEYAGTQNDNFLTRALSDLEDDIEGILQEEISRRT